ncbi:sigma-70 family RNA polymerase sigma factor [Bacillus mesophilum]|uniref:Sigma-70 family RNA polymerase sigma factor n=1 Tax=Bacillus mesophilum TaxID=1071718 RepID=A0A7V7RNZ6_9BACI|nr:sigma-70 family RNA polymerase sigma factor [Bacillus mesophilum]KAB2334278.1 sigma-70 family RNA polymerase sigma factor [Bacillus mesophilum]
MRVLIAEYRKSLRIAKQMKRIFDNTMEPSLEALEELKIINGMISDLEYAIEWMKSGRNPDGRRGVDKHGVYLTDPALLDVLPVQGVKPSDNKEMDSLQRELVEDALCTLTKRERDVFMMIKVEGLTYEHTADLLGIKKSTVQTHFERAEQKVEKRKTESLFLVS